MFTLGVDIGSTTAKAVILQDGKDIVASSIIVATVGTSGVQRAVEDVLKQTILTLSDRSNGCHRIRTADL